MDRGFASVFLHLLDICMPGQDIENVITLGEGGIA